MHADEPAGPLRLVVDLPPQFKVEKKTDGELAATKDGIRLMVFRWPGKSFQSSRSSLAQQASLGKTQFGETVVPETEVRLGSCEGYRYLIESAKTGGALEAKYLLRVPGGYVFAAIGGDIGNALAMFDMAPFEAVLASARLSSVEERALP